MEDEAGSQFRVSYVREQQAPIGSPVVAANDRAGARAAEHVIERGDVLDFAVFFRHLGTQRFPRHRLLPHLGSTWHILVDVDLLDVTSHLSVTDQSGPILVWVQPWPERQHGLRQRSTVRLNAAYPPQGSSRHPSLGLG